MTPTVSVVMATYNGERYLLEQLESIARQTYPILEIVCSDDGSVDGTRRLIHEFASTSTIPVRLHAAAERRGWIENFFTAIRLAKGDLIATCDQDDVWLSNKIELCVRPFVRDPDVAMVFHSYEVVDARLNHIVDKTFAGRKYRKRMLPPWMSLPGFALVFKSNIPGLTWSGNRPMDHHRLHEHMPHDKWVPFLATEFGACVGLPDKLVRYRQHGKNAVGMVTPGKAPPVTPSECKVLARIASQRSAVLESIDSALFLPSMEKYLALESNLDLRGELLAREAGFRRFSQLVKMVSSGAYRNARSGGLGKKAFLGDLLRVVSRQS